MSALSIEGQMRTYELVLVMPPTLDDQQVAAVVDQVRNFVLERQGEVIKVDHWGRRRLAYPIDRHREGIYVLAQFRLSPAYVSQLERRLDISEEVMRHLLVRMDEDEE
jgi:small subunit ribosomal protein S6